MNRYDWNGYQKWTRTTAVYPKKFARHYCILGLVNEAGEVAGKEKKRVRGDYNEAQVIPMIEAELGDVLWYVARLADEYGLSLQRIVDANVAKLEHRKLMGKIKGDGDDR